MRFHIPLLLLAVPLLAGCATPSAEYLGTPVQPVMREGREYRVYLRRDRDGASAQVIRMGWAGGRDHRPMMADMVAAAEEASGCHATEGGVRGDSGVLNVRLDCPG